jgi:hypothetical protein
VEPWFHDEALILLATFGACALLILGVLELLWPSRPRGDRWAHRPAAPLLTRSGHLSQEPAHDRLSVLSVVGQEQVTREPRDRASRVADLR